MVCDAKEMKTYALQYKTYNKEHQKGLLKMNKKLSFYMENCAEKSMVKVEIKIKTKIKTKTKITTSC